MRCDDIRELMSAHVDDCLDPAGEQHLADHLASCAHCRQELESLKRTVNLLHKLPPVTPPADLTAQIHAHIRRTRPLTFTAFFSLPQTRVALAASLLIVLTTLGIRQMYATRPQPGAAQLCLEQPQPAPPDVNPAPIAADAHLPVSPTAIAAKDRALLNRSGEQVVKTDQPTLRAAKAKEATQQRLEQVVAHDGTSANGTVREAQMAGLADKAGAGEPQAPFANTPNAPRPTPVPSEQRKATDEKRAIFGGRPASAENFIFRTERLADAAAIVNRYAGKNALSQPQSPGGVRRNAAVGLPNGVPSSPKAELQDMKIKGGGQISPLPVVLEVTLPLTALPALLDELRGAGAQIVNPQSYKKSDVAAAAAPTAPTDTQETARMIATVPATNILVRFTFLQPGQ